MSPKGRRFTRAAQIDRNHVRLLLNARIATGILAAQQRRVEARVELEAEWATGGEQACGRENGRAMAESSFTLLAYRLSQDPSPKIHRLLIILPYR